MTEPYSVSRLARASGHSERSEESGAGLKSPPHTTRPFAEFTLSEGKGSG